MGTSADLPVEPLNDVVGADTLSKGQSKHIVILHKLAVKQFQTLTSLSKHSVPQIGIGKENI